MSSFKLYFLKSAAPEDVDFIRRIRSSSVPSWGNFLKLLSSLFPQAEHKMNVRWCDEDGDYITMETQEEWDEAMATIKASPIKLYVRLMDLQEEQVPESKEIVFEATEEEEAIEFSVSVEYFYDSESTDPNSVSASPEVQAHLQETVSQVVERIFSQYSHIPHWLLPAVKVSAADGGDSLADINLQAFVLAIHRHALDLMSQADESSDKQAVLEESLSLLRDSALISPGDSVVAYNLACALSRLGHINEAFNSLDRSASLRGSLSVSQVMEDTDLFNLQNSPQFVDWVAAHLMDEPVDEEPIAKPKSTVEIDDLPEGDGFDEFELIKKFREAADAVEEEVKKEEAKKEEIKKEEPVVVEKVVPEKRQLALDVLAPLGFDAEVVNAILDLVDDDVEQAMAHLLGEDN